MVSVLVRALMLALLVMGLADGPAGATGAAPAVATAGEITQVVTHDGRTVTVRLAPFALRAPGFEVLVQQPDGSLVTQEVGGERGFVGSVDGDTAAVATAIRRSDGVLEGQISFDRGATWFFRDGTVYSTRGLNPPAAYKWPSSTTAARNVTTSPGQAGPTTYRWDVGYDLAHDWFTDTDTVDGSVDKALDAVESEVAAMAGLYVRDALLRPALGRVVIRAAADQDPYRSGEGLLDAITDEWEVNQSDAGVDVVVGRHTPEGGGGVAWIGTAGTGWTGASVQGAGADPVVTRHEVGHNWSVRDNHTNGPEGPTVMSGNSYDRFDGTELSSIFRHRDWLLAKATPPLTPQGTFAVPVPPYAALDLVDDVDSGVARLFRPLANDHDANGGALTLVSVAPTSALGGTASIYNDVIGYTAPPVASADTIDSLTYVVRDASGRTATGVAVFRVDPFVAPAPAAQWPDLPVSTGNYELTNRQSGYLATVKAESPSAPDLVQRAARNNYAKFSFAATGTPGVWTVRNMATQACVGTENASTAAGAKVQQQACTGSASQKWRVAQHPKGGAALVNVGSGRCLSATGSGMSSGNLLVQTNCGLTLGQSWTVAYPPVSAWPVATVPDPTKHYELRNAFSGLYAGVPAGTTSSANLVQRASGVGTRLSFTSNGDGTWAIREISTNRCLDGYGSTDAGTWSCHGGDNQRWRLLRHPGGGIALVNLQTGTCLAPTDSSKAAGVRLIRRTCDGHADHRWTLPQAAT